MLELLSSVAQLSIELRPLYGYSLLFCFASERTDGRTDERIGEESFPLADFPDMNFLRQIIPKDHFLKDIRFGQRYKFLRANLS